MALRGGPAGAGRVCSPEPRGARSSGRERRRLRGCERRGQRPGPAVSDGCDRRDRRCGARRVRCRRERCRGGRRRAPPRLHGSRRAVLARRRVLFARVRAGDRHGRPALRGLPGVLHRGDGLRGRSRLLRRPVHGRPLLPASPGVPARRRGLRRERRLLRAALLGRSLRAPVRVPRAGRALRRELGVLQRALRPRRPGSGSLRGPARVHRERQEGVHTAGRRRVRRQRRLLLGQLRAAPRRHAAMRSARRLPRRVRGLLVGHRLLLGRMQRTGHRAGRLRPRGQRPSVRRGRRDLRRHPGLLRRLDLRCPAEPRGRAPVRADVGRWRMPCERSRMRSPRGVLRRRVHPRRGWDPVVRVGLRHGR
jgi:hypothetical protein